MRHIRHLPNGCPYPGCRVNALRDTWRDEEHSEDRSDEARAELARECAELGEECCS